VLGKHFDSHEAAVKTFLSESYEQTPHPHAPDARIALPMLKRFSTPRRAATTLLPVVVCMGAIVALSSAGASATTPTYPPIAIHSSSLTQSGRYLDWRVTLRRPFSYLGFASTGRHLCLLLTEATDKTDAEPCLADPHGRPKLAGLYLYRHDVNTGRKIGMTSGGPTTVSAAFLPAAVGFKYSDHLDWEAESIGRCTSDPEGICNLTFPAMPARLAMHIPKLVGCVRKGPDFVFNGSPKVHDIALTFDDGPWGSPPSIDFVNLLHKLHVPATFFEIGDQISEFDHNGAVERLMLADGDMIGDHTWTHPVMTTLSTSAQRSELQLTLNKIRQETGFRVCIFRAPYGSTNAALESLALSMGMTTIQWNDDSRDWSLPGTQAIYDTVISEAHNGGIVIQHFGGGPRYETLAAIPEEVATLRSEGYKFVTVTQMLGYKLIYR